MILGRFYPTLLGSLLLATALVLSPAKPAHAASLCFVETGACIGEPFGDYWQASGGLPVFGFPVTTLAPEVNPDSSVAYLTQWFERERMEAHPENAAPYQVLLGRLGAQRLQQLGRDWTTFPKADPATPHYFAATGHAIAPQFWPYWQSHGLNLGDQGVSERESIALFGYPLSEPAVETNGAGDMVLTQWFERARFEYHPGNSEAFQVLLGLLGTELNPPAIPSSVPGYENRVDPVSALVSYYNAINRREYQRAYNYWDQPGTSPTSTPPDYATFVQGYADTTYVAVTLGTPAIDAGAGSVYALVPVVIIATHTDGSVRTFAGCYGMRRTQPGIDPRPDAELWRLSRANIMVARSSATPATLLNGRSCTL